VRQGVAHNRMPSAVAVAKRLGCSDDSVTAARNKIAVDMDVQVMEGPLTAPLLKYRENLKPGDINRATGEVPTEPRSFTVIVPNLPTPAAVYRAVAAWMPPLGA